MQWLILGAVLPSLVIAWAAGFGVRRIGPRWGLVDRPNARKIHQTATPTAGGLAIWLGVIGTFALGQLALGLLLWTPAGQALLEAGAVPVSVAMHLPGAWEQSGRLWLLLAGGTVLAGLGLVDDRRALDWRLRLAVETLVAVVIVLCGWRMTLFLDAPLVTGLLSVVWIVGLVNSFNMLDNMDGLSAGVGTIAAVLLAAVMLMAPDPTTRQPQWFVAGLLLVIAGASLGFLWHNRPPARLFMGDTGAYFLGYLLATATLTGTFAGGPVPKHAILAPLCVLAVPIYDTLTVVLIRLRAGRSPFQGDKSHFSHRLVELGMSPTQAVLTIYLATATCGLGALVLHQVDGAGASVIGLLVVLTLALVSILENAGRAKRPSRSQEDRNGSG